MSLIERAQEIRARLRNPPNAVVDIGIDLKRKTIPIQSVDSPAIVPINSLASFGPKHPSAADFAFGPVVYPKTDRFVRIDDIQRAVSVKYKISRLDLNSSRRTADIVRPRQIAMYLAKILTLKSLPEIGRCFGGKHHTSILHAYRKVGALRATDGQLNVEIAELIEKINDSL